jgi:alginate O-acetyltransferase complex protein AlgI
MPGWHGWGAMLVLPAAVMLFTPPQSPHWLRMWVMAVAFFVACKWLTWRRTPVEGVPIWRRLGYFYLWPGLDATAFLTGTVRRDPAPGEWLFASVKFLLGIFLLWGLYPQLEAEHWLLRGWTAMIGIVFLFHFGSFHLLSCAWRWVGVNAKPLMNWPAKSESVSEFWGQRWNTAFRDLTHRFLFRPLTDRLGPRWGIAAGFLFSGLVHEVVISWPAGGGWGGPTLYFVVQGLGLLVERSRMGRRLGLGDGVRGWLFTMLVVLGPVYWLFHPPFVNDVVIPFVDLLNGRGLP